MRFPSAAVEWSFVLWTGALLLDDFTFAWQPTHNFKPSYLFSGMRHVHFSGGAGVGSIRNHGKWSHSSKLRVSNVEVESEFRPEERDGSLEEMSGYGISETAECVREWAAAVETALQDKRRIDEVVGMFAYDGVVKVRMVEHTPMLDDAFLLFALWSSFICPRALWFPVCLHQTSPLLRTDGGAQLQRTRSCEALPNRQICSGHKNDC